jgi:ADP-heptose:LPS heptosyltransferase
MGFKKIAIIHLNQIGDLVFSLPLLRALRENFPEATIHSILRPHLEELLEGSPFVDQLISRKSGWKDRLRLLRKLRENRYDLVITLSHSVECLLLTTLSGAKVKVGFSNFPWDVGLHIKEKVEGHHGWYNNAKLLKRLNLDVTKKDYVDLLFLPSRRDTDGVASSEIAKVQGKYAVISPGTSVRRKVKAWDEGKFADLLLLLKEKYGLSPVIVGGKDDQESIQQLIQMTRGKDKAERLHPIINLAGKVGLRDLCHVLKNASLFVGVDSGIMHLASSLDIPVVGIFGPTDPFYVGPQNAKSLLVRKEELECVPCYLKGCEERECMKRIAVGDVFQACEQVLNS